MKDFMTETEAQKKQCPFVDIDIVDDQRSQPTCIASKCMAWRWSHQDSGPNDPPTGFCGAAGLPKYI